MKLTIELSEKNTPHSHRIHRYAQFVQFSKLGCILEAKFTIKNFRPNKTKFSIENLR